MPILKKMDLIKMFDMLGECSTGAAGQCKWNELRGIFSQSFKIIRLRFFFGLLVSLVYTFKRHEYSLGEYMLWTIQPDFGASNVVPCQYLDMMESIYAMAG